MATLTEVFTNIANAIRKQSNFNSDVRIKGKDLSTAIDDIDYRVKLKFNKDPEKNTKVNVYYDYNSNAADRYSYEYPNNLIEESDSTISLKLDNKQIFSSKNRFFLENENKEIFNNKFIIKANIDGCIIEEEIYIPYIGADHFKLGDRNLYQYEPEIAPFIDNVYQPLVGKNNNYAIIAGGTIIGNNYYFSSTVNLYDKNTLTLTQGQDLSEGKGTGSISSTDSYTLITGSKVNPDRVNYSIPSNIIDVYNSSMTRSILNNTNISTTYTDYIVAHHDSPSIISCNINNNIIISNYYDQKCSLSYYNNNLTQGNISISNYGYYSCINSLNKALFLTHDSSNYKLNIFDDNLIYSNINIPLLVLENISSYIEMCGNDNLLVICKRFDGYEKYMYYNNSLTSYNSEPETSYIMKSEGYNSLLFLIDNNICAFSGKLLNLDKTLMVRKFYENTYNKTSISSEIILNRFIPTDISNISYYNELPYIPLGKITLMLDETYRTHINKLIALKWIDN